MKSHCQLNHTASWIILSVKFYSTLNHAVPFKFHLFVAVQGSTGDRLELRRVAESSQKACNYLTLRMESKSHPKSVDVIWSTQATLHGTKRRGKRTDSMRRLC